MEFIITVIEIYERRFEDVRSIAVEGSDVMDAIQNAAKALREKNDTETSIRTFGNEELADPEQIKRMLSGEHDQFSISVFTLDGNWVKPWGKYGSKDLLPW